MTELILQFFLPVMSVLTIAFIIISIKYYQTIKTTQRTFNISEEHFDFSKETLSRIERNIGSLQSLLTNKREVASKPSIKNPVTAEVIGEILSRMEFEKYALIGEEKRQLATAAEVDFGVINYLLGIENFEGKEGVNEISCISFSYSVKEKSEKLIEKIFYLNTYTRLGSIGLLEMGEENVITISKSLYFKTEPIDEKALRFILFVLHLGQREILKILSEEELEFKSISLNKFMELRKNHAA